MAQTCPSVSEQNACKWRFRGQTCSRVSRAETVHGCELLCLVQDVSGHWRQLWGRLGAESTRTRATPTAPNRPPGETPLRRGTIHHPARSHGTLAEFSGRLERGPPTSRPRSGGSSALAPRSRTSTSPRPGRARHARERHERASERVSDAAHRGATVAAYRRPDVRPLTSRAARHERPRTSGDTSSEVSPCLKSGQDRGPETGSR